MTAVKTINEGRDAFAVDLANALGGDPKRAAKFMDAVELLAKESKAFQSLLYDRGQQSLDSKARNVLNASVWLAKTAGQNNDVDEMWTWLP